MSTPWVTIGIPVYNGAVTLADAVRSVLAQSFQDWELLLVDDGSTDGTGEIVRGIADSRVRTISDGVNQGLVFRLNQMISLARAPYFARMDSDDLMHPDRIARQLAYLRRHPETDLTGTAAYVIDENGTPYGVRGDNPELRFASIRAGFIHPTVTGKTEWFRRHRYDASYPRAEDRELWYRADPNTVCARLTEPLLFYRDPLALQVSKYRASCRTERRILSRYGTERLGRTGTALATARVYAKEALYLGAQATGLSRVLIRRRNRPCSREESELAEKIIARIRNLQLNAAGREPTKDTCLTEEIAVVSAQTNE